MTFIKKIKYTLLLLAVLPLGAFAQDSTKVELIDYESPKEYTIADIAVTGDLTYESYIIVGFSGLSVGDVITVPGRKISDAIKKFWKQGYFSDVQIYADTIRQDSIWLNIYLTQRPKIAEVGYHGIKTSEKEDIQEKLGIGRNTILSADLLDRIRVRIKKYFSEKGYENPLIEIAETKVEEGLVKLDITIDRREKLKVRRIIVEGNEALSLHKIDKAMKKTNRPVLWNIFRSKKFIDAHYQNDKNSVIEKYNEIGYRDAEILSDSVVRVDSTRVDIYLTVKEGKKYYFGDMVWSGNTLYPTAVLNGYLGLSKGDVFNQQQLDKRLNQDEDAVMSLYRDNGYLFAQVDPVESSIEGDTINFEFRLYEGKPATINRVIINGNDRVYDHVVRRELRTRPGEVYSQNDLVRSLRDLAQLQLFNEEKLYTGDLIQPDMENGTVDIVYNLESKSSDQFEFSAGVSPQGPVLSVGVKFTNFAIQNLFRKDMYRNIVPQGEGQTLNVRAQVNGKYYQNYSISFLEPWLGGKRPNSLSVGVYYAIQTGLSERYREALNQHLSSFYGYNYGLDNTGYTYEYDTGTRMMTLGASVGIGTRLKWPDDYFSFYTNVSYQHYRLKNWYDYYFGFSDGISNNLSMGFTLQRNSIDNPIYTRKGSTFMLSLNLTPPYSLLTGKDYSKMTAEQTRRWIEYHKWKFSGKMFVPLTRDEKLVLMARVEYGFVGYYNKYKRSPFEKFYVGGDGMSGYTAPGTETVGLRGYPSGSLTPVEPNTRTSNGNLYTRMTMELRYPILMQGTTALWALAFVEGGNCWSEFKDFNPFELKRSAGVGLRVFLPMFGLLGIDWGYGFDKPFGLPTRSGSQFTFVLGQEF